MSESLLYGQSRRSFVACAALFLVVMGAYVTEARHKYTVPFDEPLWYMRGRVPPTDLSTSEYRKWAIDVPALNRWCYWTALKVTGLDVLPAGEKRAWSIKEGSICFFGKPGYVKYVTATPENLQWFERWQGPYAPRRAIVAIRMADLAAFAALLVFLWLTARMVLHSDILAALAVLPICMLHFWLTTMAFVSGSGDIFMMAGFALTLYLWTRYHLAGLGASWKAALVIGLAAGLTTSAKQLGVVLLQAYALYLLWYAPGWRKLAVPALAVVVALAVFAAVNPVVFAHPAARPWQVFSMMVARRGEVVAEAVGRLGVLGYSEILNREFFWLPYLPVAAIAFWSLRREPWLPPVLLWCAFIVCATAFGMAQMRYFQRNYLAPLEMSLYFTLALTVLALVARHHRTQAPPAAK